MRCSGAIGGGFLLGSISWSLYAQVPKPWAMLGSRLSGLPSGGFWHVEPLPFGNVLPLLAKHPCGSTLSPLLAARLLLALIRFYQRYLSPFLGGQCRFFPSCSHYALACIEGHGALQGFLLSVKRLCKCHPLHPGGHDPPPPPLPKRGPAPGASRNPARGAGAPGGPIEEVFTDGS